MKKFKKIVAAVLASTMVFSAMAVSTFAADSYTAKLGFASTGFAVGSWDQATTVTGAGTYSITYNIPDGTTVSGVEVFVVDIEGMLTADDGTFMDVADSNFSISDAQVTIDGTDVTTTFIYGDTEEKGNMRIEFYNAYGPTNPDKLATWDGGTFAGDGTTSAFDPATFTASSSITVSFTVADSDTAAGDSTTTTALIVAAVAALAVVATVSTKKVAFQK